MVHSVLMTQVELPLFYASSIVSIGCWVSAGSHSYFPLSSPRTKVKDTPPQVSLGSVQGRMYYTLTGYLAVSQSVLQMMVMAVQPVRPPDDGDGSPASQASR